MKEDLYLHPTQTDGEPEGVPSATTDQIEVVPAGIAEQEPTRHATPAGKGPVSAAKKSANRANSLKSTGPRSVLGKHHSRGNAVKHGLLARETLFTPDGRIKDPELLSVYERLLEENQCDDLYAGFLVEDTIVAYAGYRKALVLEGKSEARNEWYPVRDTQLQRYLNGHRKSLRHNFQQLQKQKAERTEPEEWTMEPEPQEPAEPGWKEDVSDLAKLDAGFFAHELTHECQSPRGDLVDEPAKETIPESFQPPVAAEPAETSGSVSPTAAEPCARQCSPSDVVRVGDNCETSPTNTQATIRVGTDGPQSYSESGSAPDDFAASPPAVSRDESGVTDGDPAVTAPHVSAHEEVNDGFPQPGE